MSTNVQPIEKEGDNVVEGADTTLLNTNVSPTRANPWEFICGTSD